jgi:hypothetical protein
MPVAFGWSGVDDTTPAAQLLFSYQIDGQGWSTFSTDISASYSDLADGPHTFEVMAKDLSGNEDPSSAIRNFVVDALGNPPQISNINVSVGQQQATISWTTDKPATSQIEYGLTDAYGSSTSWETELVTEHTIVITGIAPDTTYHYRIKSKDACGRETVSEDRQFTTLPVPDLQVVSINIPVEAWTGSAFDVTWTVTNAGAAPASGTWVDRVYLSADDQFGSDILLGEFTYSGGLESGQSISRTQAVTINRSGITNANYYIIVVTDAANNIFEYTGENNNTLVSGTPIAVHLTPLPDLQVSLVDAPATAQAGQTISVSWRICNNGEGPTDAASWYERVYLSPDTDKSHSIKDYGQFVNGSYLAPGECYTESRNLTLPAGISGPHYIIVETDSTHQVSESDESNNTGHSSSAIEIAYVAPGFLHVESVIVAPAPPTTVWAGEQVTVTWTVTNTGETAITGTWDDAVALSPTPTWDGVNGYWGVIHHIYFNGPLAVGASYSHTASFTVPQGIVSGTWYVVPVVDTHYFAGGDGSIGSGNIPRDQGSAPITVAIPPPADLEVTTVDAPLTGTAGQAINVKWTTINNGANATYSGGWNDAVYLSADDIFDMATDTLIGTYWHSGVLEPSVSYNQSVNAALPPDVSGNYYIFVYADSSNNVNEEPWENNNSNYDSTPVEIQIPPLPLPPDLQVAAINGPASALPGQAVTISWTVQNNGTGPTGVASWNDKVYLSSDDTLNTSSDILLGTFGHSGVLAVSESYTQIQVVTIPHCISGQYYLFAVTDSDNKVNENTGEGNNVRRADSTILITAGQYADLQVSGINLPATANAGEPVAISWTITNAGDGIAIGSWTDTVYLSTDTQLNTSTDIHLGVFTHTGNLASGDNYVQNQSPMLPIGLSGNFYLIVATDNDNALRECAGEENNIAVSSSQVQISISTYPDLQVTTVDAPANAASGQIVTVNWTITNNGTSATPASQGWYDTVYLSKDQILDIAFDTKLGAFQRVKSLAAGESYTQSAQVEIPRSASGPYYIFIVTDSTNSIFEHTAENNNTGYDPSAMIVTMPPPADLVVSSVDVPLSGTPGQAATINWTVTNQGINTASGQWTDSVYLSTDTMWDIDDQLIGRKDYAGGLVASASYNQSLTAPLPAVSPGSYYAIVRTDIRNNVRESNEINNGGSSAGTISIDVPELTLGAPHTAEISTGTEHYYKVNVPAGEDLLVTLDCNDNNASTEFYVRYGAIPDRGHYDFMHEKPLEADQEITIPSTQDGWYYILARGNSVPVVSTGYTIKAELMQFSIRSVSPAKVGNAGYVTVRIEGARFEKAVTAFLIMPDGSQMAPVVMESYFTNTIYATFDMGDQPVGLYSVQVRNTSGEVRTLSGGLTVTEGGNARLVAHVIAPGIARVDRWFPIQIEYRNDGNIDLPVPYLILASDRDDFLIDDGTERIANITGFLAIGSDDLPILQPGAHFTYKVSAKAQVGLSKLVLFTSATGGELTSGLEEPNTGQTENNSAMSKLVSLYAPNGDLASDSQSSGIDQMRSTPAIFKLASSTGCTDRSDGKFPIMVTFDDVEGIDDPEFPGQAKIFGLIDAVGAQVCCFVNFEDDSPGFERAWLKKLKDPSEGMAKHPEVFKELLERIYVGCHGYHHWTSKWSDDNIAQREVLDWLAKAEQITGQKWSLSDLLVRAPGWDMSDAALDQLRLDRAIPVGGHTIGDLMRKFPVLPATILEVARSARNAFSNHKREHPDQPFVLVLHEPFISSSDVKYILGKLINEGGVLVDFDPRCVQGLDPYGSNRRSVGSVVDSGSIVSGRSLDPNRKIKPTGFGQLAFVAGQETMPYMVEFENVPDATAPAEMIHITDVLDPNLDMRTFRLGEIVFGDHVINVPENKSYYQARIQLGPEHNNIVADISAGLDIQSGQVFWIMTAIDPNTGEQPENPLIGLLPPNDPNTHSGEGYVTYTIKPKADLSTGSKITNTATIIFGNNEPLATNEVFNTIDSGKPSSEVEALPATISGSEFLVSWSGTDDANGSGLASYDIYVSIDGESFEHWLTNTDATSAVFTAADANGHNYAFYSIARDNVGNTEEPPAQPDATTATLDLMPPQAMFVSGDFTSEPDGYTFTVRYSDNNAIDVSTLDTNDIRVIGPNGFEQLAEFVGVNDTNNGTPRMARYRFAAPGGSWNAADNGVYNLSIEPNQVSDTSGNFVADGLLRVFAVTDSSVGQLVLESYNIISTTRVGRTVFEYVFTVTLRNGTSSEYSDVEFELYNAPANMTILDSNVVFAHIEPGESVTSQGTLKVLIDRSATTDLYYIPWRITFEPEKVLGDFTGDRKVDIDDLGVFAAYWLTDEPSTDIAPSQEPDGITNFLDFSVFAQYWLYVLY